MPAGAPPHGGPGGGAHLHNFPHGSDDDVVMLAEMRQTRAGARLDGVARRRLLPLRAAAELHSRRSSGDGRASGRRWRRISGGGCCSSFTAHPLLSPPSCSPRGTTVGTWVPRHVGVALGSGGLWIWRSHGRPQRSSLLSGVPVQGKKL
jgi:hypothetical protein